MLEPSTAGDSACHLFPTTEILAILNDPLRPGCPVMGFIERRISLMADQLAAVVVLMFKGTRTNFQPLKSKRFAWPVHVPSPVAKLIQVWVGSFGLDNGVV